MLIKTGLENTSTNDEFLVVHFNSEILAISSVAMAPETAEVIDHISLTGGALAVLFKGKNLKKLEADFKKTQKKNLLASFWRATLPLETLKAFYYLHKPKEVSSLIFAEVVTVPETLLVIEKTFSLGAEILEVRSQRVSNKNFLVIGTSSQNYKPVLAQLKKSFKKIKICGAEKPNASLLRAFVVLKPD